MASTMDLLCSCRAPRFFVCCLYCNVVCLAGCVGLYVPNSRQSRTNRMELQSLVPSLKISRTSDFSYSSLHFLASNQNCDERPDTFGFSPSLPSTSYCEHFVICCSLSPQLVSSPKQPSFLSSGRAIRRSKTRYVYLCRFHLRASFSMSNGPSALNMARLIIGQGRVSS